jgi:DNA-binding NarL/FixJ family response regulator
MEPIRILIVDNNEMIIGGLKAVLVFDEAVQNQIKVVSVLFNEREVLNRLKKKDVDLILMDINMPYINGIKLTELVKSIYPQVKIVGYTSYDNEVFRNDMERAGADGYVLKEETAERLVNEILRVSGRLDSKFSGTKVAVNA